MLTKWALGDSSRTTFREEIPDTGGAAVIPLTLRIVFILTVLETDKYNSGTETLLP
jgi:hypothetical protein